MTTPPVGATATANPDESQLARHSGRAWKLVFALATLASAIPVLSTRYLPLTDVLGAPKETGRRGVAARLARSPQLFFTTSTMP